MCGVWCRDGRAIGSLRVEMKLAVPVSELWDLYVKEHPEEKVTTTRHFCNFPSPSPPRR